MLTISVPMEEVYDPVQNLFYEQKAQVLTLEHSLVSLSKWESKWKKPFFSKEDKTEEETIDYIRCMTVNQNVDPQVYQRLGPSEYRQINAYIGDPMTATTFSKRRKAPKSSEIITSELIYYWMVAYQIPFECQKWHLNRLLTLIQICDVKNEQPEKMSKKAIYGQNASLNAARRRAAHSRG